MYSNANYEHLLYRVQLQPSRGLYIMTGISTILAYPKIRMSNSKHLFKTVESLIQSPRILKMQIRKMKKLRITTNLSKIVLLLKVILQFLQNSMLKITAKIIQETDIKFLT